MTETSSSEGTSDGKLCRDCGAPFGPSDDKRFSLCSNCRPADLPEEGWEPVTLDVELEAPPAIEERDYYWCGATKDCPFDVTLGGIEFPKTIGRIVPDGAGHRDLMTPDADNGAVHRLTPANVKLVKEHCANKVVRHWRQTVHQGYDGSEHVTFLGEQRAIKGRRPYTRDPSDKPLGQFVYMLKVRGPKDRPVEEPPTMVPRDW